MASLNIEITLDNASFEDSSEVSRILRKLADRIEIQVIEGEVVANDTEFWLMDINGARVGSALVEE